MQNSTKSLLILVAVLLFGMIIGGAVTATYIRHNITAVLARSPQEARADLIRTFTERLELNAKQQKLFETRVGELQQQAQRLHERTQSRLRELISRFTAELKPILSEAQRRELNRMAAEMSGRALPPPPLPPGE